MKTNAAVLWEENTPWSVEEIDLDPPRAGEVLVELAASGLCHSDEHVVTGDLRGFVGPLPTVGGHEGAGVVLEVGEGVRSVAPGDHVVFGFVPACGTCPSCATGHSNLCDLGGLTASGMQVSDLTTRHHARGRDLSLAIGSLGTFAHHTVVNEASCIRIDRTHRLDRACLLGCGVVTGWGSAVNAGRVAPGDLVAVVGIGGIGASAVLGARAARAPSSAASARARSSAPGRRVPGSSPSSTRWRSSARRPWSSAPPTPTGRSPRRAPTWPAPPGTAGSTS